MGTVVISAMNVQKAVENGLRFAREIIVKWSQNIRIEAGHITQLRTGTYNSTSI